MKRIYQDLDNVTEWALNKLHLKMLKLFAYPMLRYRFIKRPLLYEENHKRWKEELKEKDKKEFGRNNGKGGKTENGKIYRRKKD